LDQSCFSDEQIIHDKKQIRNPNELKLGKFYCRMRNDPVKGLIKVFNVFEILELDSPERGWYRARSINPDGSSHEVVYCMACNGIIPYDDEVAKGKWDAYNYLYEVKRPDYA
jgi:hypothetical protein